MTIRNETMLGLGKPRTVTWDDAIDPFVVTREALGGSDLPRVAAKLPVLRARQITQPELWADTSETLTASDYLYMATVLGMKGCFRYIPLFGGGGGITATELATAVSTKCPDGSGFSICFVQYARSSNIGAQTGAQDGAAAVSYLKNLTVPSNVTWSQDLDVNANVSNATAYSNDSFSASTAAGWDATAPMMYAEPGYPLSAAQRYGLYVHRYWATAANDPNKYVASRGCQVLQLWASNRGEYFPRPGLVIDADVIQADYFGSYPVVVQAAA